MQSEQRLDLPYHEPGIIHDIREYPVKDPHDVIVVSDPCGAKPGHTANSYTEDSLLRQPPVADYLALSLIVTLVFNPVLGVFALLCSLSSRRALQDGRYKAARRRARLAKILNLIAVVTWCVACMLLASLVVKHQYFRELRDEWGERINA